MLKCTQFEPVDSIPCPSCGETIRYYRLGGMGNVCPHFYCDVCSNVFHRVSDFDRIYGRTATRELLDSIAATLPACPCGGRFAAGTNPKCPACGFELEHQNSAVERLHDPQAVVIESAMYCCEQEG